MHFDLRARLFETSFIFSLKEKRETHSPDAVTAFVLSFGMSVVVKAVV